METTKQMLKGTFNEDCDCILLRLDLNTAGVLDQYCHNHNISVNLGLNSLIMYGLGSQVKRFPKTKKRGQWSLENGARKISLRLQGSTGFRLRRFANKHNASLNGALNYIIKRELQKEVSNDRRTLGTR